MITLKKYGLYINGQWKNSSDGRTFETINPANGSILASFARAAAEDVEKSVDAAKRSYSAWKDYPAPKRGEILLKAASIMRERKRELGELVTLEMGKVIAEGLGDVQEAIDFLEYISGEGRRLFGETTKSELPNKFCMTLRQPVGVVGCITPWNFPLAIPCWKLGAALISGNTVVFKPASLTPLCAAVLIEIFDEAGLPPGVLNMVTGPADIVGRTIVEHELVKAISFTGGIDAGKDVYLRAARSLKKVGLELGGKNPQIIMNDAPIDLAIEGVIFGAFGTAGQRCTATSRLIVHESVYNIVLERLLSRTKFLRIGDPIDPLIDVGPVSCEKQEHKIMNYIKIGIQEGAKLLCGGTKLMSGDYTNTCDMISSV